VDSSRAIRVEIRGVSIDHASKSVAQNYAVFVNGADVTLSQCKITSHTGAGIGVERGKLQINDCAVSDCKAHGIAVLGSKSYAQVSGGSIIKNGLDGILLRDGARARVEDAVIASNGRYGLELIDCVGEPLAAGGRASRVEKNSKGDVEGFCDDADDADDPAAG